MVLRLPILRPSRFERNFVKAGSYFSNATATVSRCFAVGPKVQQTFIPAKKIHQAAVVSFADMKKLRQLLIGAFRPDANPTLARFLGPH